MVMYFIRRRLGEGANIHSECQIAITVEKVKSRSMAEQVEIKLSSSESIKKIWLGFEEMVTCT